MSQHIKFTRNPTYELPSELVFDHINTSEFRVGDWEILKQPDGGLLFKHIDGAPIYLNRYGSLAVTAINAENITCNAMNTVTTNTPWFHDIGPEIKLDGGTRIDGTLQLGHLRVINNVTANSVRTPRFSADKYINP